MKPVVRSETSRQQTLRRLVWRRRTNTAVLLIATGMLIVGSLVKAARRGDESAFSFDDAAPRQVVRIVDGQSFEVAAGHIVRLLGVDSLFERHPEAEQSGLPARSTAFLEQQVLGRQLVLEFDRQRVAADNAVLAWCFDGHRCINVALVEQGLAAADLRRPLRPDLKSELKHAEEAAKENRRGAWSALGPDHASDP